MFANAFGILALSLCSSLPALSCDALFVTSPRRSFSGLSGVNGTILVDITDQNGTIAPFADIQLNGAIYRNGEMTETGDDYYSVVVGYSEDPTLEVGLSTADVPDALMLVLKLWFVEEADAISFTDGFSDYISLTNGFYFDDAWYNYNGRCYEAQVNAMYDGIEERLQTLVTFDYPIATTYTLNKSFVNCSYVASSGDKALPSSYTDATLDNPYFIKVVADSGYYFKKDGSAFSVTGGITIDSIVYDNLVVGDFASYFLIQVRLPSGDCSISFTAVDSASITKNLSGCTTTFPDTYSFGASGTYRIVANDGYCFDSRLDQYSTTGMLVHSVAFANKVYGDLYTTIVLDVTFSDVNAVSVTATAQTYSAQYAQGYNDGEQSGLELKGGLMDLIPNVFASIGAFLFTFSGVNFMGINLLAVVGIVVSVGLIGVVIKVALK